MLTATAVLLLVWLLAGCAAGRSGDGQQEAQHQEGAVSSGKIVFVGPGVGQSDVLDRGDVYVMNADGSNERNLTHTTAHESYPVWSPDGQKIAFIRDFDHAFVINADGSGETRLTDDTLPFSQLAWSPDGQKIAFERRVHVYKKESSSVVSAGASASVDAVSVERMSGIFVMNADGTDLNKLPNTESRTSPAWSPDGQKIAFTEESAMANPGVYVINSDGTGQTRLTDTMVSEHDPIWLPNGEKIAFNASNPQKEKHVICVINADGTDRTCLAKGWMS